MDTVTLTIDGRPVTVEKGKTVLQAAIESGISLGAGEPRLSDPVVCGATPAGVEDPAGRGDALHGLVHAASYSNIADAAAR